MISIERTDLTSSSYTGDVARIVGETSNKLLHFSEYFFLLIYTPVFSAVRKWTGDEGGCQRIKKVDFEEPHPNTKQPIEELKTQGIFAQQSHLKTALTALLVALQILFALALSPIWLSTLLLAAALRLGVQGYMNAFTYLEPEKSAERKGLSLKLLSLNVALSEFDTMNTTNGLSSTNSRIDEMSSFLLKQKADVLCLQEAFAGDKICATMAKKLQKKGYHVLFTSKRKHCLAMTAGLLIASKLPIKRAAFQPYTNGFGADSHANKGTLVVALDAGGDREIVIGNTHLQDAFDRGSEYEQRKIQCNAAKQAVFSDFKAHSAQRFLLGDFNAGKESCSGCSEGDRQAFQDVFKDLENLIKEKGTFLRSFSPSFRHYQQLQKVPDAAAHIDHIFRKQSKQKYESTTLLPVGEKAGILSDHMAVVATVSLSKD